MVKNNRISSESLQDRKMLGWIITPIVRTLTDIHDAIKGTKYYPEVQDVHVENDNSNIILEVAKNTRGLKDRLDKFLEKEIKVNAAPVPPINVQPLADSVSKLEKTFKEIKTYDTVTVKNLSDIKIPPPATEIIVKNLKDLPQTVVNTEKTDLSPLVKLLEGLKSAVSDMSGTISRLKPVVNVPAPVVKVEAQKEVTVKGIKDTTDEVIGLRADIEKLYDMLEEKNDELKLAVKENGGSKGSVSYSGSTITSVSLNGLRGVPVSTAVDVQNSPTLLPAVALPLRRSLIIYNNSANTVYIGGVDVTIADGLPIPASSFSPPIDAGQVMKVYGIAATTSEVRVLEVSSDLEGA